MSNAPEPEINAIKVVLELSAEERALGALKDRSDPGLALGLLRALPPPQAQADGLEPRMGKGLKAIAEALCVLGRVDALHLIKKAGYSLSSAPGEDSLLTMAARGRQGLCAQWLIDQEPELCSIYGVNGALPIAHAVAAKAHDATRYLAQATPIEARGANGEDAFKALCKGASPVVIREYFASLTKEQTAMALRSQDNQGSSGLMMVIERAPAEIVEGVIERAKRCGALKEERNHKGESGLHLLCRRAALSFAGSAKREALAPSVARRLMERLLDAGFDPTPVSRDGQLALNDLISPFVLDYNREVPKEIVELAGFLISRGADPDAENGRGLSARMLSKSAKGPSAAGIVAAIDAFDVTLATKSLASMPFADEERAPRVAASTLRI